MNDLDGAFAEDAELDASLIAADQQRRTPRGRSTSNSSASLSYKKSGTSLSTAASEQTPLLAAGQEIGDDGGRGRVGSWVADFSSLPWWKRPSIYWILPIFMIATLAFGGVIVPQVNLIMELVCRNYIADQSLADPNFTMAPVVFGAENPQCRDPGVQARIAQFTLSANAISGLLSAIISPKLGALSDRYGRKPLIVFASFGGFFKELIMINAARNPDTFPVSWILVGYALDGLSGSFTALMAIVHSYATDTTAPEKRNAAFGYFHSCLFVGIALGPFFAGKIIEATGTVLTIFYIAFCFHICFIVSFIFLIPESLTKARQLAAREQHKQQRATMRENADWQISLRSMNILEPLKILFPKGPGASAALRRNLVLLSAIDTIIFGVAMGSMTVVVIYVKYQFGWDTVTTSYFTSAVSSSRVLALLVILPFLTWAFRTRTSNPSLSPQERQLHRGAGSVDLNIIRFAVFFDTLGYLGYSLSRSGSLFVLSGCLAAAGGIGSPTLQSALTKHVPPEKTGQILGANGLLHALARVAGPAVFNGIYSLTVGKYTQTVFVSLTATFVVAFICTWFVKPNVYLHDVNDDATPEDAEPDDQAV